MTISDRPRRSPFAKNRNRPPVVPRDSLISGNFHAWNDEPFNFAQRCERDYFGIANIRLFHRIVYVVTDPHMVEEMFVDQHKSFYKGIGHDEAKSLFGEGLLTSDGEVWQRHRKMLHPFFHSGRVPTYSGKIEACAREVLAEWRDGETRNIYRDMNRVCLAILLRSLFGRDIPGALDPVARAAAALHQSHNRWTYRSAEFKSAKRDFDRLVDEIIADLRDDRDSNGQIDKSESGDLVNVLLRAHLSDPKAVTAQHVHDQVATMLLSGFETTASGVTFALYFLAKHPDVCAQVRGEIHALGASVALGDVSPEALPTLMLAVSESLRLLPPAHRLTRRAVAPVKLGPYDFAAGSEFLIPIWAIHRSARVFENPETFLPSRWTRELRRSLPRYAYMPFGSGPRACIGQSMALREMLTIVACVVSSFELMPASSEELVPYNGLTLIPGGGTVPLSVKHVKRSRALDSSPIATL